MTIYYKVVENKNGVLNSSWVDVHDVTLTVSYEVGEWTQGAVKGSALFVFKTLDRAEEYRRLNNRCFHKHLEIYTCKIKGKRKIMPFFYSGSTLREKLQEYSKRVNKSKQRIGKLPRHWFGPPPKGTVAASSVKLIEKV